MNAGTRYGVRGPALRGARCQCPICGRMFASVRPFDRHRAGPMDRRRCLTDAEMTFAGFRLDPYGAYALAPRPGRAGGSLGRAARAGGKAILAGMSP